MLVTTICENNYPAAKRQIQKAMAYPIDGIELRLDYLKKINLEKIKDLKKSFSIPMIFTLRKKSQGGYFCGRENKRLKIIQQLLALEPEYFDIEYDVPIDFIKKIHGVFTKTKLICSYHDFQETPKNFNKLLSSLPKKYFSIYKIATFAKSSLDSIRMLNFVQAHQNVCGLCMGDLGKITRILSALVNHTFNYVCIDPKKTTAPGQIDLETLFTVYHYQTLNKKTKIYALLGQFIDHSIGHIFHNERFQKLHENAVYIKIPLKEHELDTFFKKIKTLPFKGFSVTMPFKEKVVKYVDTFSKDAKKIKAINTLVKKNHRWIGYNTDGIGAMNAIEKRMKVKNKKVVLLGAGGTAKSIAFEAIKRGANVIILNRTLSRAKKIAKTLHCEADNLNRAKNLHHENYDILINATSVGMNHQENISLLPTAAIISKTIVLDMINTAQPTPFLKIAKTKQCTCISGREVFIEQALEQTHIWFS